ncbi:GGDEF domain-containing protein [Kineococcus rubinsiae]|uniref:GGDEF domain-containing protein n=1 Tax=Kineococcus rubinsiae TaxID=2609562 RepID=UPI0014300166|nr:diguanylate cyclase [Kineococcus rubinsiae]
MTTSLLVAAFASSVVACALTAVLAWRRRAQNTAAKALAAAMAGVALWSATGIFAHLPVPFVLQQDTAVVSFVGIYLTLTGLWCLSRAVTDRNWHLRLTVALRLLAPPLVLLGLLFTDDRHHLFFTSVRASADGEELLAQVGPLFHVHLAYCYLVLAWVVLRLVVAWWGAASVFRHQLSHLLIACCVPVLGNTVVLTTARGEHPVDYTPLFLALAGLVAARAIFRFGLLRLVPVARAQVVDGIEDAVVVLDVDGRVIDVNPAAVALLARSASGRAGDVIGFPAAQVLPPQLSELLAGAALRERLELTAGVHVDARVSALRDTRGRALGQVVVLRDVSELIEQRELAQQANERLSEQLALTRTLQQRLAEEAVRDAPTGLHNRRHLLQALGEAVESAQVTGEPLSVVLIDVDHFKLVNDTHGHQGGDAVLRAVADQLRDSCRAGDTLARYGGEEFVLVLPATSRADAVQRAEELRRRCEEAVVDLPVLAASLRGDVSISVTFSAGVATSPGHGTDADALIAVADRALYAAKAAGRNQVVAAR